MKLELSEEQAAVLVEALDLYSRCLIGQFEEVGQVALLYSVNMLDSEVRQSTYSDNPATYIAHKPDKKAWDAHHDFTDTIRKLKQEYLGIHSNGSYGIHSEEVHDSARVAYDVLQVVRHHLAWGRHKGDCVMGTLGVSFDTPVQTSKIGLPKIVEDLK